MESLKAEGVEHVFGIPGGANLPTYDALVRRRPAPRPGPPRAGRRPRGRGLRQGLRAGSGSRSATSGPGATNLVTAIADAMMDSVPTVFITGQVRTDLIGTDGFQEADIIGITLPIVKHSLHGHRPAPHPRVHPRGLPHRLDRPARARCWSTSRRTSRAPTSTTSRAPRPVDLPGYKPSTEGNIKQIRIAAKALANARRPVIYAGGGVINANASEELRELCRLRPLPGHLDPDGPRRLPGRRTTSGSGCSACTAPAPPTTRWTRPT